MTNDPTNEQLFPIQHSNGRDYMVTRADVARLGEEGIFSPRKCPQCGCMCQGLEPLYPLATAAELIPVPTPGALRWLLYRYKKMLGRPLYRKMQGHRVRMISVTEICKIRDILINSYSARRGPSDPMLSILRGANGLDETKKADLLADEIERRANA